MFMLVLCYGTYTVYKLHLTSCKFVTWLLTLVWTKGHSTGHIEEPPPCDIKYKCAQLSWNLEHIVAKPWAKFNPDLINICRVI